MTKRLRVAGVVVAGLLVGATVGVPNVQAEPVAAERASRGVTLTSAAKEVDEGDRLKLTAKIGSPRKAKQLTLQNLQPPLYPGDEADWLDVKKVGVRGRATIDVQVVPTRENTEHYRVVVTYRGSKPVASKSLGITVWRWIPLREYRPYYDTGGTIFGNYMINGRAYSGFGAAYSSRAGSWETRFTPGRNCIEFRGLLGVDDRSADGSSGVISVTADDVPVYQSPSLTPGMQELMSVALDRPYRLGVQILDSTPEEVAGESWPGIADPALRCTGV